MRTFKKLCGVAVTDEETKNRGITLSSYRIWSAMINRCYSEKYQSNNPTYIGCTVCDEWLLFSNFKKWFDINYRDEFALDKDILIEGNKVYSPDTCRFVPQYLNLLLTDHRNARGDLPLGITALVPDIHRPKRKTTTYRAQCCVLDGKQTSKTFKTIEEAKAWYSDTKKSIVKQQAQRAFLDNAIKTDVYLALVRREF